MAKFWAVFKREYLERVRTKSFIIATIFGPLLLGAIMVIPAVMAAKQMRAARIDRVQILDATGMELGRDVRRMLFMTRGDSAAPAADTSTITLRTVSAAELAAAESLATAAVMQKELTGYVVLDSATVAGTRARYAGREASSVGQMEILEQAIRQTVLRTRLEREGLDPARIATLTQVRLQMQTERISDKGRGGSGMASTVLGFVLAFLLYMSLILYGQNILRSVLEEKTTRVSEVIVASVKTDTLLTGKVLGVAAVSLTQMVFWAVSAVALYFARDTIFQQLNITSPAAITLPPVSLGIAVAFLLFFVFGFIFYASLFAAAGATVSSDQEAQQAAQPIMMLLVASIIFLNPILVVGSSRVDLQACKLEYSIVSPK